MGQVLKFLGKGCLYKCEVGQGKWDVYLDNTLGRGHLLEGKDKGWRLACLGMSKRGLNKEGVDEKVESEDRGAVRETSEGEFEGLIKE